MAIRTAQITYEVRIEKPPLTATNVPGLYPIDTGGRAGAGQALRVLNLVRNGQDACTVYFDASLGEWKLEREDLRDLDALQVSERLSEDQRINVTRTQTQLFGPGVGAYFHPLAKHLTIDDSDTLQHQETPDVIQSTRLEPGCMADRLFVMAASTSISNVTLDGRSMVCLNMDVSGGAYILYVDPEVGYRYRLFEAYGRSGSLLERTIVDDYRVVNGIPYPFKYERHKWRANGELYEHMIIEVSKAVLNQDLPEGALELILPAGTTVQHVATFTAAVPTRQMTVVTVADLPNLGRRLAEEWRASQLQKGGKGADTAKPDAVGDAGTIEALPPNTEGIEANSQAGAAEPGTEPAELTTPYATHEVPESQIVDAASKRHTPDAPAVSLVAPEAANGGTLGSEKHGPRPISGASQAASSVAGLVDTDHASPDKAQPLGEAASQPPVSSALYSSRLFSAILAFAVLCCAALVTKRLLDKAGQAKAS